MSGSDWKDRLNIVYSTDPGFQYEKHREDQPVHISAGQQDLRVWLERRGGGKVATLIKGFRGSESELKDLAAMLKNRCGVGGGAKNGEIIVQGDHRDRVMAILLKEGFKAKKAGG